MRFLALSIILSVTSSSMSVSVCIYKKRYRVGSLNLQYFTSIIIPITAIIFFFDKLQNYRFNTIML